VVWSTGRSITSPFRINATFQPSAGGVGDPDEPRGRSGRASMSFEYGSPYVKSKP